MSTHSLRTRREPSLVGEFAAALLHRVLTPLIEWRNRRTQRATSARPDFGVDEQYVPELHGIGVQVVEDRVFGLYCGTDLVADAGTIQFAVADYTDAWPTGYFDITCTVDTAREAAVNLAFAGGAA